MSIDVNPSTEGIELFSSRIDLSKLKEAVVKIKEQLAKVIVGQEEFIELLLVSLFSLSLVQLVIIFTI